LAEARDTLLCSPHDRQFKKNNGVMKPIRRINTPDGPCEGPGAEGSLCGRPIENKTHRLCGGHYAQKNRARELVPLKILRKSGEVRRCSFTGCRYNDAPDGDGMCRHHWRQHQTGLELSSLPGVPHRGIAVLDRDSEGNKFCKPCDRWLPIEEFTKCSAARDGLNYLCRRCNASKRMKAKYGIDLDHYEILFVAQQRHCAICPEGPGKGRRLAVDHNHECCPGTVSCGRCIRGLLCPNCNRGLGLFMDKLEIVKSAAAYLLLNAMVA
jgi:hypothetical protein